MPVKTLTALEQDDYKSLPEATFIKGYYRAYAKYLNADASVIIQRFDEIYVNDTGLKANHALNNSPIKIMGKLSGSKSVYKIGHLATKMMLKLKRRKQKVLMSKLYRWEWQRTQLLAIS